ncbi:MAG: spermidine synthase [Rivularia sp. (in: cyanobacteria)]
MKNTTIDINNWIWDSSSPSNFFAHKLCQTIVSQKTAYQEMQIVETEGYGKSLILDDKWQSSVVDEFIYHESLVQPAMINHGSPRQVLILGGGEGATIREVLRWKTVERLVMVDIDGEVVEACRQHLPEMHQGAFEDPRVEIIIDDALKFLETTTPQWDIIISDLSDPILSGPSYPLFTQEYFKTISAVLNSDGFFVVQAGSVCPVSMTAYVRIAKTLSTVFPYTLPYASFVPCFGEPWGYILASPKPCSNRPEPEEVDKLLTEKTTGGLRMIDGISLLGILQSPAYIRRAIEKETEICTLANPPQHLGQGIIEQSS